MLVLLKKAREDYVEGRAMCSNELSRKKGWKGLWNLKVPSKIKGTHYKCSQLKKYETQLNVKFVVLMKIHGSMHCYTVLYHVEVCVGLDGCRCYRIIIIIKHL